MSNQSTLPFAEVENKTSIIEVNTKNKYWLFKLLLDGNYMMSKISSNPQYRFCIYQGNNVPIKAIKVIEFTRLIKLLRKNGNHYLLDKRKVRKLHGKSNLKKLYKQHLKQKQKCQFK